MVIRFPIALAFRTHSTGTVFVRRHANDHRQAETAGVQANAASSPEDKGEHEDEPSASQRARCSLPRSTVYLSMRRVATTNDIEGVLGRALKREKDGVLEAPQQSALVLFLDDVHVAQEV